MNYIVSHADSKVSREIVSFSESNHAIYADLYRYTSIFDHTNTSYPKRDSRWRKIELILEILEYPDTELVVWMDYDAFFVLKSDTSLEKLMSHLPSTGSLYFSKSPNIPNAPYINSGVFIVRNNDFSKIFFRDVWSTGVIDEKMYNPAKYGFSCPGGDQNTIIHLLHTTYKHMLAREIHIVDSAYFNSRPEHSEILHDTFVLHLAGANKEKRIKEFLKLI